MVGTVGGDIILVGLIALPYMLRQGYDKSLACGSVLAGGGLGVLIPPSILFIIYGLQSGTSIGELFIAGVVPGLLLAALYAVTSFSGLVCSRIWRQRWAKNIWCKASWQIWPWGRRYFCRVC